MLLPGSFSQGDSGFDSGSRGRRWPSVRSVNDKSISLAACTLETCQPSGYFWTRTEGESNATSLCLCLLTFFLLFLSEFTSTLSYLSRAGMVTGDVINTSKNYMIKQTFLCVCVCVWGTAGQP